MTRPASGETTEALEDAVLIAGPTASGKSAFALDYATRHGGAIINCDSMQVYTVLNVLTARPAPEDLELVPHHLYGYVHPTETYSTGRWLADVARLLKSSRLGGRRPVFVGGTGLYFRALTEGLSEMPEIPSVVRRRLREEMSEFGPEAMHARLAALDPAAAEAIRATDPQRILRALEVFEVSGRSILAWREQRTRPLVRSESAEKLLLLPDRDVLNRRIERRLDGMIEMGALSEVQALRDLDLEPAMPAMKAIGIPQLMAALDGSSTLEASVARAKTATRQFAKRQVTWFRNQLDDSWTRLDGQVDPDGATER